MNPTRRTERVASLIRTILAEALQTSLNDPRIPAITSITRVEVSPDFALAKVYVSVYAPEKKRDLCLQALRSSAGHLRYLLGQELTLRKTPTLDFRLDDSLRRGFETVQLIDEVMAQSRPAGTDADAPDAAAAPEATAGDGAAAGDEGAREDT
jgi:ribosome-binding factor A